MRRRFAFPVIVLAMLAVAAVAPAATVAKAPGALYVDVKSQATIIEGGSAALLRVRASCPVGYEVLEGFVYIVQDGSESQWAGIPLTCDGKQHRFVLRVSAFDESPFHAGDARATAFLLVIDPDTQATLDAGDSQALKLRPA